MCDLLALESDPLLAMFPKSYAIIKTLEKKFPK